MTLIYGIIECYQTLVIWKNDEAHLFSSLCEVLLSIFVLNFYFILQQYTFFSFTMLSEMLSILPMSICLLERVYFFLFHFNHDCQVFLMFCFALC